MAMMPSPPGLFSMTTGCPHLACSFSANSRAPISAPAPGPNGTMNFTARVGQFCAWAERRKHYTKQSQHGPNSPEIQIHDGSPS